MNDELDPSWYTISRFQPDEVDVETLLKLLSHPRWEVRFNAARAIRSQHDEHIVNSLLAAFEREKHEAVRHMLARVLSTLHEAGINIPLFTEVKNPIQETRRQLAIKRLKELKVQIDSDKEEYDELLVPNKLNAPQFIEIGYLMAQLVETPFPDHYSPLADSVVSAVLPQWSQPSIAFVESYPHGMKFRIYRQKE